MKPSASTVDRNPCRLAAASSHTARRRGCRQVVAASSSRVGSPVSSVGRQSSTDGVSAGSPRAVIVGEVTSTPPGACSFAVAVPTTSTGVSSGGSTGRPSGPSLTTTCARPVRSRTTRKVTAAMLAASVHPALQSDRLAGGSLAGARPSSFVLIVSPPVAGQPWRCGRGQGRGATTPSPTFDGAVGLLVGARSHEGCQASRAAESRSTATQARESRKPRSGCGQVAVAVVLDEAEPLVEGQGGCVVAQHLEVRRRRALLRGPADQRGHHGQAQPLTSPGRCHLDRPEAGPVTVDRADSGRGVSDRGPSRAVPRRAARRRAPRQQAVVAVPRFRPAGTPCRGRGSPAPSRGP